MKRETAPSGKPQPSPLSRPDAFIPGEEGTDGAGARARNNTSGISGFCFRFDGSIGGNNYCYSVEAAGEAVLFTYESMEHPDLGRAETAVDAGVLERLNELYLRCRLAEWDGYAKYNSYVCDGSGFSLRIRFRDGASLRASGTNAFPPRYRAFCEAMGAVLDPVRDAVLAAAGKKQP